MLRVAVWSGGRAKSLKEKMSRLEFGWRGMWKLVSGITKDG